MTVGELMELLRAAPSENMEVVVSIDDVLCPIDSEFTGTANLNDEDMFVIEMVEEDEEAPPTPRDGSVPS